jgi:endonuclease/exonuclease/phosphatase family metal-dependent hydrolase
VLVRSWNLFHGNTSPPRRRAYLEEMVRLVTADEPDVVCLQEVPVWALARLEGWSGMRVLAAVARKPRLPVGLGRRLTALHTGVFRSLFTGQANALLVRRELEILLESILVLNEASLLGIGVGERRVGQLARLRRPNDSNVLLSNLHASQSAGHAQEQVERAAAHVLELAEPEEPVVLAGDFNVTPDLRHLGFSEGGPGIDHVLVRGDDPGPLHVWPDERRSMDGMLLSDHAPVERALQ